MNTQLITSWALTAVFMATGGYSLVRMAMPGTATARKSHATHVLMCAAMAAMPWAWAADVPPFPVIVVFMVAGVWHLAVAAFRPGDIARQPRHARILGATHATMMFAMVWMTVLMAYVGGSHPAGSSMAGMSDASGMWVPEQTMQGQPMSTMSMPGHTGQPWWAHGLTAALVAGFLAAACWFAVVRGSRPRAEGEPTHRLELGDGVAGGVMAVAMAASLATMW